MKNQIDRTTRTEEMKKIIENIKKIVIEDTRLFFEPYVTVGRFFRRIFRAMVSGAKRSAKNGKKGGDQ